MYRLKYGIGFSQHLKVIETQDSQPELCKICIAHPVRTRVAMFCMLRTINLNDNACTGCVEVNDIVSDWLLAIELNTI